MMSVPSSSSYGLTAVPGPVVLPSAVAKSVGPKVPKVADSASLYYFLILSFFLLLIVHYLLSGRESGLKDKVNDASCATCEASSGEGQRRAKFNRTAGAI